MSRSEDAVADLKDALRASLGLRKPETSEPMPDSAPVRCTSCEWWGPSSELNAACGCPLCGSPAEPIPPLDPQEVIERCERETGHAQVEGANFCRCAHVMFDGPVDPAQSPSPVTRARGPVDLPEALQGETLVESLAKAATYARYDHRDIAGWPTQLLEAAQTALTVTEDQLQSQADQHARLLKDFGKVTAQFEQSVADHAETLEKWRTVVADEQAAREDRERFRAVSAKLARELKEVTEQRDALADALAESRPAVLHQHKEWLRLGAITPAAAMEVEDRLDSALRLAGRVP